jgi:hypothetical protein
MKILFLSLSDRKVLYSITFDRLKKYCEKYNYSFHYKASIIDSSRHISWSKIPFLLEQMDSYPDYDLYVWIDDDIYITNLDIDFYALIEPYSFNCLLFSQDVIPECPLNAGVLVCKNNEQTTKILNQVYDMVDEIGTRFKHNWEQDGFIKYYNEYNKNNNIVTIPHRIIQSFYRNYSLPHSMRWQPNDFSAHITGMNLEDRLKILDKLKLNIP